MVRGPWLQSTRAQSLQLFSISSTFTMSMFQRDPRAGAFLGGDRVSGQDIRDQNGAF